MQNIRILLIDDEPEIGYVFKKFFNRYGSEIFYLTGGEELSARLAEIKPQAAVVDLKLLNNRNGLDILHEIRLEDPLLPVVIITGYGTVKDAVEAMKTGACDFIEKPVDLHKLRKIISEAVRVRDEKERRLKNRRGKKTSRAVSLSSRETEILRFYARGYSYEQITSLLSISKYTVKSHIEHIKKKLNTTSRHDIISLAKKNSLI